MKSTHAKNEIESVIARLEGLTTQAGIYGSVNVLARCKSAESAHQMFDTMRRALAVIRDFKNQECKNKLTADETAYLEFVFQRARQLPLTDLPL